MHNNPHIGDQGEHWFGMSLPRNWFLQPPKRDFGKDGFVVIRDGSDLHNLEFAIQVKTTQRQSIRDGKVVKSGISRSAISYWFANPIPTLVVAVDIKDQRGWYAWHMDLFDSPRKVPQNSSKTVTIRIPDQNQLDEHGWEAIRARLRRFYSSLGRAVAIASASSTLSPTVRALVLGVRNLASVAHLPGGAAGAHPDLEPVLALFEQTQHRDMLAAARTLLPSLQAGDEGRTQIESWIESYESTALLAYPLLRDLPDGDTFGPEVKIAVASEIVPEVRARLMTAGLDMILALMSGRAPVSSGVNEKSPPSEA